MPNTYTKLYVETLFGVKKKNACIEEHFRKKLHAVIGNLINEMGCRTIIINGVADHVHCFFELKSTTSLSDLMKSAKAKSSKWINESHFLSEHFEWQRGFEGFSCCPSSVDETYKSIEFQERIHQSISFREECEIKLKKYKIEYDEKYWFEDLI